MSIPKEVPAVSKPKNSVVIAYGKDKDRYSVRARVGCRRVNGGNRPVNGPTIGHIIEGRYVPLTEPEEPRNVSLSPTVDVKDWAGIILCCMVFHNILKELKQVFSHDDSLKIYCITILRVCNPGIKDYELKEAYENCFLSEKYPGAFRDARKAAKEEQDWLARAKKEDFFSMEELNRKQKSFGTIVLGCDIDTTCETIYAAYSKRWEIEIVMRFYKSACEFNETRVHEDYSVNDAVVGYSSETSRTGEE